jgi:hypothetical protein
MAWYSYFPKNHLLGDLSQFIYTLEDLVQAGESDSDSPEVQKGISFLLSKQTNPKWWLG